MIKTMITEDYVSFEVAKLLKEKGLIMSNKPIKVVRYEQVVIINNKMYQEVADLGCRHCDYMKDKAKCDLEICPCVGETMLKEINMEE